MAPVNSLAGATMEDATTAAKPRQSDPAINPRHLAAVIEGLRLRTDGALRIIDRGAIIDVARHVLDLHQWLVRQTPVRKARSSGRGSVWQHRAASAPEARRGARTHPVAPRWSDSGRSIARAVHPSG